jgi:branched-subunit amino acid permease
MIAISPSSSTHVWINAFGILITATSLPSLALMMHDSSTASVVTVGKLASAFLGNVVSLFVSSSHGPSFEGAVSFLLEKHVQFQHCLALGLQ